MSMRNALMGLDPETAQIIAGIGAYEIMGENNGGVQTVSLNNPSTRDQAAAQILARNGALLRDVPPSKSRIFPLGFVSTGAVAAGLQAIVISRPQVIYRGERLSIPSDIAGDFVLDDVKVGKNSQFVAEGPIPARTLQENAWGVLLQLDTAQISQNIQLTVTNVAGAPRTFRATMFGNAVE